MARTLAPLLAALLLLCPASLSAQFGEGRMPRGQAATTEVLTIGGTWGFPCALNWRCSAWSEEQWEALEVVAWVGPDRFEGEFLPDSNFFGGFEVSVQVPPARRGELVLVEVLAASPEGHTARFQSLQGTAARLLEEAGPGGRIGNSEHRPNNVTVLTTALVGLLEEANAGQWRMPEPRLLALLHEVDPNRLLRHAQVFQGINLGIMPGAGSVDPNALIASTDAVEAYLAGVPGQLLEDAYSSLDWGGATAFQEIDFLGLDKTMVPASAPGTVSFGRRDGVRMRMIDDWSEDGFVGSVMDTGATGRVSAMFLPNIDSYPRSARVVRPGHPSFEFEDIHVDCPGVGPVQVLRISARMPSMFRRMAMLAGLEFVEFTESRTLAYRLPVNVDPACRDALPSGEVRRHYYAAHPALQLPRGRMGPVLHAGPVAMQLLNPDPVLGDEDAQFIAGTVDFSTAGWWRRAMPRRESLACRRRAS
ncbi:hypothetical protein [Alkalisalibacterium limincola]|uniref:Uncharacterized protein n=1 Tax=Alkalisalibacterium limincola TaxID=2699169 RepID=A0A5C8KW25_9GAMM|nr:hypothetical protein [Alkalisalibacterium limincola]TXK64570.1 hypothetical protein FU658_06770 [Alkalisalibacterium limincola]